MAFPASSVLSAAAVHWRRSAIIALVALSASGCVGRSPNTTASIGSGRAPLSQEEWRQQAEFWAARFESNPADRQAALNYARALRATEQRAQAVAVLQQAALRSPNDLELLAAYGKALADAARFKEAQEVLSRAHIPERPDWRILSAQGAVADQTGDHALAQNYYEAALRIAPDEPSVLSNLGLSYALSKRLPEAEQRLKQAAAHPQADGRVRQNLALVLGLQGRFRDAEDVLRRDVAPEEAARTVAMLRQMVSQPNSWAAIRGNERKAARPEKGHGAKAGEGGAMRLPSRLDNDQG